MKADLLITNIGQLATCASDEKPKRRSAMRDVGVICDAAVAVKDGKFIAIGKRREIESTVSAEKAVDAEGRAVVPGLVDPHTHFVFAGDRLDEFELKLKGVEYLEILAAGGGILSTVKATRGSGEDELLLASRRRLDKMLRCGTTTAEIKTGYGLDLESELKMLRVIERLDREHPVDLVPTFLAAHAVPPEFRDTPDDYVELICGEMLPAVWRWYSESHFRSDRTPFFCDVFCEKGAFTLEQATRVWSAAQELGFGVKAHVEQFNDLGGSGMAVKMGAASVDHLDVTSEDAVRRLAASKTVAVVIPTENFNAGKTRFADARKLIDSGCAVALSTDFNPGSAPCPSQPMAMAIASRYQKLLPSETLNATTINAACAVGLGDRSGSIEIGKTADLILCDCADYRQLTYEFGGDLVNKVIKAGGLIDIC